MPTNASTVKLGSPMEIDGYYGSVSEGPVVEVQTGNGVGTGNEIATGNNIGTGATVVTCDHTDSPPNEWHTCNHPYHSLYSESNLPPLLFQLDAPEDEPSGKILTLIENGKPVFDYTGRPMRYFPFLPRYISNKAPAWLLEYWMRTDTRLTYRDIKGRMVKGGKPLPSDNALNMRRERDARTPLNLSCWTTRRGIVTKAEVERVEKLSADQVACNTTMDIEYDVVDGVTQPVALRPKSLKPAVSRLYPLDTFISFEAQPHIASDRLKESIEMLEHLQDVAITLHLDTDDWKSLSSEYLPAPWVQKSMKLRKDPVSPKYHDAKPAPQKPDPRKPTPENIVKSPRSVTTVSSASPMTPSTPNMMIYNLPLDRPHQGYIPTPTATPDTFIKRTTITLSDILNSEPATDYGAKPKPAPFALHRQADPVSANMSRPIPKTFASPTANLPIFPRAHHSHRVHKDTLLGRNSSDPFAKFRGDSASLFRTLEELAADYIRS